MTEVTLEQKVAESLISEIGPDSAAVQRFQDKEEQKFLGIVSRLNELQALLEEVQSFEQFSDPKPLCEHLQMIFDSIDATEQFVADIKQRLILLNQEVERRNPSKLRIGSLFSKAKKEKTQTPLDLNLVTYNTDKLLEKYGLEKTTEAAAE